MNKIEYRSALQKALVGYSADLREEVLSDFDEYVDESLKDGVDEQEILSGFGTIEEVIGSIDDSYKVNEVVPLPVQYSVVNETLMIRYDRNTSCDLEIEKTEDNELSYEITDYNRLFKKQQTVFVNIDYENNQTILTVKSISNHKVMNGKVSVYVPAFYQDVLIEGVVGDIEIDDLKLASMKMQILKGDITIDNCDMDVLGIVGKSGDIEIHDFKGKTVALNTSMGDIGLNDIDVTSIGIESSTGDISLDDTNSNKIMISSSTGDIKINDSKTEVLQIEGKAGDIELNDIDYCNKVDVTTYAGDIKINDVKAITISVNDKAGDISLQDVHTDRAEVSCATGDIDLSLSDINDLEVSSSFGDISIDVPYEVYRKGRKYYMEKDGCDKEIIISRTLGDLSINGEEE